MKKEVLVILILLFVSFPAVENLFLPGGFTSHDLTHHVVRQVSMNKLLSEGQFPPRWSGELNNGYGYPVFLFNYPLPAMIGEVFHKVGFDFVDSAKAVLFLSMVVSVVGMYLFLKQLLGSRLAAFLGAVFYLYAPLRLSNIYVSAAVGSALALGIVPFVFWSMVEIRKSQRVKESKSQRWVLIGALSVAALILAHNVTAVIFAPVMAVFAWVLIRESRGIRVMRGIGIMVLLGLGMSVWFWLPALIEKSYIRFDEVYSGFYKDQFITLWQLLRSPWGYGLSHPASPEQGDMSYQLGLVQIGVMLLLIPLIWVRREIRVIGGVCLGLFALSVFLMLKISLPVWEKVPFLSLIQFPLRFQAISIFMAAIGAALLIKYLPFRKVVFGILFILVIYANRNHWNINQQYDPGEGYYLNLKTTSTTYGEHLPKWGRVMVKGHPAKLEIVGGFGEFRVIKDQSGRLEAEAEVSEAAKVRLNQFYFPGWQIKVDGKPVKLNYLLEGESYGLPLFDIEKGKHLVEAEFKNTPVRSIADGISLVSVVIWGGLLCKLSLRSLLKVKRFS